MTWRDYLALGVLGLLVVLLVAMFQMTPGYMDAEYYFAGGLRLAHGQGFSELFIWNFLDDPQGLPHASHAYWMPLASVVTWLGMALVGSNSFFAGRSGFLLLAVLIPPLTSALAYRLLPRREAAWLAGLLAVFSVFYLSYLPTTDTFALTMLFGACWLWLAAGYPLGIGRFWVEGKAFAAVNALCLGIVSGLMHLSRADGLIWLLIALGAILVWRSEEEYRVPRHDSYPNGVWGGWKSAAIPLALCLSGYLLVMAPWIWRNLAVFGSPLAPGGIKALWFIDYNDLYLFPVSLITAQRWLASGLAQIFNVRLWALGQNLQTVLAVQGSIVLAPLMVWGLWRSRHERLVQAGLAAWVSLLVLMTVVFPFAGARGGFFHSGAALQPLFWAVTPIGLQGFLEWGARKRGWDSTQAPRVFGTAMIALAAILSVVVVAGRVVGSDWRHPVWGASARQYDILGRELDELGVGDQEIVLVNNPPGFFLSAGRPAISIPAGGLGSLLSVAEKFNARFLILEGNHPPELDHLYQQPEQQDGLRYIKTIGGAHLFELRPDG